MTAALAPELRLVAINLTWRCNLACAHCYLDAGTQSDGARGSGRGELGCEEVCALLDQIAGHSAQAMVVLTGGEPLLRRDLEAIVEHGARLGLTMVIGSNGTALTDARVAALKRAGLAGAGISVDSLDAGRHDRFRGLPGCWRKTMAGIEACRRHGLSWQLHFTLTAENAHELPAMVDFARENGARVLSVFFLVCTGRARGMTDLTPEQYERALAAIIQLQQRNPDLIVRPRCAPHFKRIAYQTDPASPLARISGFDGDGCLAGVGYCRVAPDGAVTPCPYIEQTAGNIRARPFAEIWEGSELFAALRAPKLTGACGACEFRRLCGGCRARPAARGGGLLDADPLCAYRPRGEAVIQPWSETRSGVVWSEAALARLQRIPGFVRSMVKQRAEAYVRELGQDQVQPEHLHALAARRFGSAIPGGCMAGGRPGAPKWEET